MEVIISVTALSNLMTVLIERYASRTLPSRGCNGGARGQQQRTDQEASGLETNTNETTPIEDDARRRLPEDNIEALEARLSQLRAQAKDLSSPDTFVQYARVSREANRVEKELLEKKGKTDSVLRTLKEWSWLGNRLDMITRAANVAGTLTFSCLVTM